MEKKFKNMQPKSNGWWEFLENGNDYPIKVLLVENGSEVAKDDEVAEALGIKWEGDETLENNNISNWYEMNPTSQMDGKWRKLATEQA